MSGSPTRSFWQWRWFSSDQVIFWCFMFLVKKHAAFKWKDAIPGFPVSLGSAEALLRLGGKIKYILIAYFLGNICAKNCRNRTVYVRIIASCKGGTLFETRCTIVFRPLYKTTCVSRHPQIRTGRFCWLKVLLPACPCWWQQAHLDEGEDPRVLLTGVTCTVSIPLAKESKLAQIPLEIDH